MPAVKPGLPAKTERGGALARPRQAEPPHRKSAFDQYLEEITRIPLLTREEELALAQEYQETGSKEAGQRLVQANLRFVVKLAYSYRHYNVKLIDLIQEGNIGLMKAVEKFNPERGYRLISYAVWWIKAYMQNYVIRSWSMVRMGTTQMQRQLFFRMQSDKESQEQQSVEETLDEEGGTELGSHSGTVLVPAEVKRHRASGEMNIASRDFSLDALVDSESKLTYVDLLPSQDPQQEDQLARREVMDQVASHLAEIVQTLSDKELYVLENRLLTDSPETLQEIGERFKVSRERIRQIESGLKEQIRKALKSIEGVADMV